MTVAAIVLAIVAATGAACTSDPPAAPTEAEYAAALTGICAQTADRLATLTQPDDVSAVGSFAAAVSDALRTEADRARDLVAPDALDADHRAFIRNADEQASAWEQLSATSPDAPEFGELTREIGELTLGRNELVAEMGVAGCARSDG